jgi:hypothetical protein
VFKKMSVGASATAGGAVFINGYAFILFWHLDNSEPQKASTGEKLKTPS